MLKHLDTLLKISWIVTLIQDPFFIATQPAIGLRLKCSERTIRSYFDILTALDAPLISHGRMGWELEDGWDLWAALKRYCEEKIENKGIKPDQFWDEQQIGTLINHQNDSIP